MRKAQNRSTNKNVETFADAGEVHFVTVFGGAGKRQIQFQAKGLGSVSLATDRTTSPFESQFRALCDSALYIVARTLSPCSPGNSARFCNSLLLTI